MTGRNFTSHMVHIRVNMHVVHTYNTHINTYYSHIYFLIIVKFIVAFEAFAIR